MNRDEIPTPSAVYQLRVTLREISPLIWRRLLVRDDSTLADLHYALQIALGWSDVHLHRFTLRGRTYGIPQIGGIGYTANARHVRLADLRLRAHERFVYAYDFTDGWVFDIRLEQRLPLDARWMYPVCTGGARAGPPEDCGGPWAFMALRQRYTPITILERLVALRESSTEDERDDAREERAELGYWLGSERIDRRAINRRLQLYVTGGAWWDACDEEEG